MKEAIAVYERCLAKFGIELRFVSHRSNIFDGSAVYMEEKDFDDPPLLLSNIAHEVAHCLAAAPERRRAKEWGLGDSYEPHRGTLLVESKSKAEAEEHRASMLGILLQKHVEGREAALYTWEFHNWDAVLPCSGAKETIHELLEEGLVVFKGLKPKILDEI